MNPEDVAMTYLKQARILEIFLKNIIENNYSADELRMMLLIIGQKYCDLLHNLAKFTPTLSSYNILFYKIDALEEPPFDKEFFMKDP